MAKVSGVREKLQFPLYDAFFVPGKIGESDARSFRQAMTDPRMIRFFVDVQNKTKLETNLQSAGMLPGLNSFEARAMRVVVSSIDEGENPHLFRFDPAMAPNLAQLISREPKILAELIYSSVTTLLVGEKVMIEVPTFFFPAGAGVSPGVAGVTNHGEPDPLATFRFAEPVVIEPQQNFRVEMLFPQGVPGKDGLPGDLANVKGPWRVWVVLDGYLTRDVQ